MSIKSFLKSQRESLKPKDRALFKLALWFGILIWMVAYAILGVVFSQIGGALLENLQGLFLSGPTLALVFKIWLMFTVLLTDVLIARWVHRKLLGVK